MVISDTTLHRILSLINSDKLDKFGAERLFDAYTRTRTGTLTGKNQGDNVAYFLYVLATYIHFSFVGVIKLCRNIQ